MKSIDALLDLLAAHPEWLPVFVWPVLSALLSFAFPWVSDRYPRIGRVLSAFGLDAASVLRAAKSTTDAELAKRRASYQIDAMAEDGSLPPVARKAHRPPPLPVLLSVIAAGAMGLFGCGAAQETLRVVRVSSEVIAVAEPCLVAAYEVEQRKCLELATLTEAEACVARVRAAWDPIEEAFATLRSARCAVEPTKCASEVQ